MTQMIGRALRGEKAGGTAKAYIVSFLDDWQEYIAWVNPEKLFIDTNADFTEQTSERRAFVTRLVSIAKLEEFARLADDNLDDGRIRYDGPVSLPCGRGAGSFAFQKGERKRT